MSSGFSFGPTTTTAPSFGTGSLTFGAPTNQPTQYGFGTLTSAAPSLFSAPGAPTTAMANPPAFGTPATSASTGFSLGTSFGTSVTTAPATGFAFGSPAPSFSFSAPATTAASSGLSFGAPASTGLTFGTPTVSTGLSFGAPASTGLSFATASTAAPSFATAISTPTTGLTFGATTSGPSTGFSFGSASSAPNTGLTFGAPTTTPAIGLNFGATSTAPSLGLGLGTAITTAAGSGLSFGAPTTSAGFGFGTSTPSLGLGGLGATSIPGFGLTTTTTTTQQNVGLGGISFTQSKAGTTSSTQKEQPPKDQLLPNEFSQLVEQFKTVVQTEKNRSAEVAHCNVKEYIKVEREIDSLNQQFSLVENQQLYNRSLAEKLKYETAKGLQNIEMAQRTQNTPAGLQFDNSAPTQYFLDLADNFEREMQFLKVKIDNTEKFMKKCNDPNVLKSQDLTEGLKRLHETFVALAGQMQSVHSQAEAQKEAFLQLRKQTMHDNVNPFEKIDPSVEAINLVMKSALQAASPMMASGPTPFNSIALGSNNLTLASHTQTAPFQSTTTSAGTFGTSMTAPFGAASSNPSTFGSGPFLLNTSSNFQLQKPPTGTKRGKQ